jgi:hypothetical protein
MQSRPSIVHVGQLFALQEIDSQIDTRQARLAAIDARLEQDEALAPLRAAVATLEDERRPLIARLRDLETVVEDGRRHIETEETKLYSGTIRSPRDLDDLQKEVESLKRTQQAREDELLTLLSQVEDLDARLGAARRELGEAQAAWEREQEDLRAEREQLAAEISALEQQRQPQFERLAPEVQQLYEQLRRTRGGRAVVRVERGTCQGCRISLPMNIVQRARSGTTIVQCSSCGRILFAS